MGIQGHQLYTIHGHESSINDVCFSQNGKYFASCSDKPFVMVWKTNFDQTMDDKENEKLENTVKKSNKNFVKKKKKIKCKQQTKASSNTKAKVTVLQKNQPIKAIDNMKIGSSMNKSAIMTNGDQMRKENVMLDASQRPATAPSKAKKSNQQQQQLRQQQEEEIKINASHPSNNS